MNDGSDIEDIKSLYKKDNKIDIYVIAAGILLSFAFSFYNLVRLELSDPIYIKVYAYLSIVITGYTVRIFHVLYRRVR